MSLHDSMQQIPDDVRDAALRGSPAVGGALIYSLTLSQWVGILTLLYLVLQIGLLIPKYLAEYRKWRKARKDCE